jgi:hypothetical protein
MALVSPTARWPPTDRPIAVLVARAPASHWPRLNKCRSKGRWHQSVCNEFLRPPTHNAAPCSGQAPPPPLPRPLHVQTQGTCHPLLTKRNRERNSDRSPPPPPPAPATPHNDMKKPAVRTLGARAGLLAVGRGRLGIWGRMIIGGPVCALRRWSVVADRPLRRARSST